MSSGVWSNIARYLDSSRDYVIGAALAFIFRKDKWVEEVQPLGGLV